MISVILAFAYINDNMMIYPNAVPLLSAYYGSFGMSGGIVSTAADMSKWILFQLAEGETPDGTEILSDAGFRVSNTFDLFDIIYLMKCRYHGVKCCIVFGCANLLCFSWM